MDKRLLLPAVLLLASPIAAHHSSAMFDQRREVALTGQVKAFEWTNPHSWLQLQVAAQNGQGPREWSVEMGSPNSISRGGWRKTSFKPGDTVTVTLNPMRDGSPGGLFVSARDAAGHAMPAQ